MIAVCRVTQQDVARRIGVNRATVSLALNGHPAVSARMRARVRSAARELGYEPDPMLSALSFYRNEHRPKGSRGKLGWIASTGLESRQWAASHVAACFEGARRRAEHHGYAIEAIDLVGESLTLNRALSILHARGIRGALLCAEGAAVLEVTAPILKNVSVVTVGHSGLHPLCPAVAPARFDAAYRTLREVVLRGYRRVGLALASRAGAEAVPDLLGGYFAGTELAGLTPIRPLFASDVAAFKRWREGHEPDALVFETEHLAADLRDAWNSRAGDIGVACLALENGDRGLAGIVPSSQRIGDIAAERLLRLLQRPEPVPVSLPERVLIGGEWVPGATLRPPIAGTVLPPAPAPRPQTGSKPHSAILSLASTTPP